MIEKLLKTKSYVYDYLLADGRNAHKEFQIVMANGSEYSNANVVNAIIDSVPNVLPLSICEILVDNISMYKLQDNVKRRIHMPNTPIFINMKKALKDHKESKKHL